MKPLGFSVQVTALMVLLLFCFTAFFAKLGGRGLASYDDLYYAEKAREMLVLNDYFTPHFNYIPSLETSPFFLWLVAGSYHVFGVSEYAASVPSAILATLTIVLLFVWVRFRFNTQVAFLSALVLATIPQYLKFTRHVMMDITLTFFCVLSLICFYEATKGKRWLYLVAGLAAACGILTKSVLGTFPLVIAFVFLLLSRRWREFLSGYLWGGVVIALGLGGSWYFAQYAINFDQFNQDFLQNILVARSVYALETDFLHRIKYLILPVQYIPHWCLFIFLGLALAVKRAWYRSDLHLLLVLWLVLIVAILTASANTKTWYMMSAFPALAILAGIGLDWLIQRFAKSPEQFYQRLFAGVAAAVLIFNLVVMMTPLQLSAQRETDQREFSPYANQLGLAGYTLISYRADHFSLNNAMLFYSDFAFVPVIQELSTLLGRLESTGPVAVMIPKPYWSEVQRPGVILLKEGRNYVLVSNRPFDFSRISNLNSRWMN